jgi:hypothetical protein
MTEEPEPSRTESVEEGPWIARERDAAWTAKLVVLRVTRLDDIHHFGACVREHQRHIDELARWARVRSATLDGAALREPSFSTREPHVIGALVEPAAVLGAMAAIEARRVAHYQAREALVPRSSRGAFDRLLEAHRADAVARLDWLRSRLAQFDLAQPAAAE